MILQYPNTGKVFVPPVNSVKGADGNWSNSSLAALQFETRCRVEPNTGNQFIIGSDGNQLTFKSIVYMPLPNRVSSIIDPVTTQVSEIIYAGETILYIVPADKDGEFEVVLDSLLGQLFTLVVDGRPLIKDTEFEIQASGFKMLIESLIPGQRFEITKYYLFRTGISGNNGVVTGSDFEIKPGSLFEVWDSERLIVKTEVKQFSKGQLNMRVWL